MTWLNYQHLYYFWSVVKEGTITAACERLRLSQPTISTQIKTLEETLGQRLFLRRGKRLELTDAGRMTYRYASQIFELGEELLAGLEGRSVEGRLPLRVGIADVVSKQVAYRILRPALSSAQPMQVCCFEGKPSALFARLSIHELDLVISDLPISPEINVKGFNHLLGRSGLEVVGIRRLAGKYWDGFPESLNGAPMLLPTQNTSLRRLLDHWFLKRGIRPAIVAEFEDTALMRVFGQAGEGLFIVPTIIEHDVHRIHGICPVGALNSVQMEYYGISLEEKLTHPGVIAIVETAHDLLEM